MPTKTYRKSGFTVIELLIVLAIIGLLFAVAFHGLVNGKEKAQKINCINNLKLIDEAKAAFVRNNHKDGTYMVAPSDICGPGKYLSQAPVCPAGGGYTIGAVNVAPTCSIPEHVLPDTRPYPPEKLRSRQVMIGNCSFIWIEKSADDEGIKSTLEELNSFEIAHPDLKITGRQVMLDSYSSQKIMGIFVWHEPRTNAIALERSQ